MTAIHWVSGTACDFFLSLYVLHDAANFGMRPAWAAGVRQRVSAKNRETLEQVFSFSRVPLTWISRLPAPQDAQTALDAVASLDPARRLPLLTLPSEMTSETVKLLKNIAERGKWTAEERADVILHYRHEPKPSSRGFDILLKSWLDLAGNGEKYLAALQEYYDVFFAEEETRIRPVLQKALAQAQDLAGKVSPVKLVEHLSRGVRLEHPETLTDLTLFPSWWSTPLAFLSQPERGKIWFAYGVRPVLPPDAEAAEAPETLVNALKSLADPTRLRILRYLTQGAKSPSELARRLRLRPPTVIHHLYLLRFAGVVQVTVGENFEKRYAVRQEALQSIYSALEAFLESNGKHR